MKLSKKLLADLLSNVYS